MNIRKTFCLLALAGVAFLPLGAGAATYNSTGDASGSGSVNANVGTPGVQLNASGNAGANAGTATNGDTSTSSDAGNGMNAGSDTGLTGGLHTNGLGIEIMSSGQVTSDADLQVFSDNLMVRDENVADANAQAAGSADLSYYHKGRLFGIFPIRVKTRTWVSNDANGSLRVNTTLPWWSAFVTGTGKVKNVVDNELSDSTSFSADMHASADASARARVLEAIARAHASADASGSASAGK